MVDLATYSSYALSSYDVVVVVMGKLLSFRVVINYRARLFSPFVCMLLGGDVYRVIFSRSLIRSSIRLIRLYN